MKKSTQSKKIKRIDVIEFDERFYQVDDKYYPSVTYILDSTYPTGYGLIKWIGDVGTIRAEQIRDDAGEEGSFVHNAIDQMLKGKIVESNDIETIFKKAERILKVKKCLISFLYFMDEYKPKILSTEFIVINSKEKYAGTVDLKCEIQGKKYLIDYKTSKSISDNHKAQICAYNEADNKNEFIPALLHLGNTTKKGYSFLEVKEKESYLRQFKLANKMFQELNPDAKPKIEIFPDKFFINMEIYSSAKNNELNSQELEKKKTKKCKKCNKEIELNNFYKDKSYKDGYYSTCKACIKKGK